MNLQNAILRLAKGGDEQRAIEAGEIDAVVDYAGSNIILLPAARRALFERKARAISEREPVLPRNRAAGAENDLLGALPRTEYQRLRPGFEPVTLKFGEILHEPGVPMPYAYFPTDSLISLLTTVQGHQALEVGLVGHEGMVSVALSLGIDVSPARALVQAGGTALRMDASRFRRECAQSVALQRTVLRYTHALMSQIAQAAACNRFHFVEERLARWLMMTRDRVRSNEFRLTHELLADMLGVRRVGVTNAASALQERGLIRYMHGRITILDERRLGAAACECYRIIKRAYGDAT